MHGVNTEQREHAVSVMADTEKEGSWAEMYCQNTPHWQTRPYVITGSIFRIIQEQLNPSASTGI